MDRYRRDRIAIGLAGLTISCAGALWFGVEEIAEWQPEVLTAIAVVSGVGLPLVAVIAHRAPLYLAGVEPLNIWRITLIGVFLLLLISAVYSPHDAVSAAGLIVAVGTALAITALRWIGV